MDEKAYLGMKMKIKIKIKIEKFRK